MGSMELNQDRASAWLLLMERSLNERFAEVDRAPIIHEGQAVQMAYEREIREATGSRSSSCPVGREMAG